MAISLQLQMERNPLKYILKLWFGGIWPLEPMKGQHTAKSYHYGVWHVWWASFWRIFCFWQAQQYTRDMTSSPTPADGSSTSNFSSTAQDVVEAESDFQSEGTGDCQAPKVMCCYSSAGHWRFFQLEDENFNIWQVAERCSWALWNPSWFQA